MQKSIASILCVLSFVAFAAPTVSYQTATNIAKEVIDQKVTKQFVENLGIEAGVSEDRARDIVDASFDGGTNAVNIALTDRYTKAATDAKFFPRVSDVESADPGILSWGGTQVDQKLILRVGTLEVPELTVGRKNFADKQDSINVVGILKGDGLGIISTATKSSTSADPANADYRDPQDNTCHRTEFTEWSHDHQTSFGEIGQPSFNNGVWNWKDENGNNVLFASGTEDDTDLYFRDVDNTQEIQLHSTRSPVCTDGKKFVTSDVVDGKVSSAVSTNNPAFVSAVRNTPTENMPEDMPTDWGTYGTVGAALAALAAFVKWAKAKTVAVIGSGGKPTDQFATDLLGKQVAKDAIHDSGGVQHDYNGYYVNIEV